MTTYVACFDTAGTQSDPGGLVTVGIIAERNRLMMFRNRWREALDRFGLRHLHMAEFDKAHRRQPVDANIEFLCTLVRLIRAGVNKVVVSGIDLSAYREVNEGGALNSRVGGGYSVTQSACMFNAIGWLIEKKRPNDRLEIVVEHGDVGQEDWKHRFEKITQYRPSTLRKADSNLPELHT